jgi:hypothetical protein
MRSTIGAAAVAVALLAGGCGGGGEAPSDAAPPSGGHASVPDDSAAAKQRGTRGPATERDAFLPVLKGEYVRVTWPKRYTMSVDAIWSKMAAGAQDTALGPVDARQAVSIWNVCAWMLQLVDDTKAGDPVAGDLRRLDERAAEDTGLRPTLDQVAEGARLGDLTTAQQFVEANGCSHGFA